MSERTLPVVDGVLTKLSASSIETFDISSTWGCPAKWYFENVLGKVRPDDASTILGTETHTNIEEYIEAARVARSTGYSPAMSLGKVALSGKEHIDWVIPHIVQIENWMGGKKLNILGVPVNGRIDVEYRMDRRGILDWKTTSDIGRYAKNKNELQDSIQLILYAAWLLEQYPEEQVVEVCLVYFQTRGRKSEKVGPVALSREFVRQALTDRIEPLVEQMKFVASLHDVALTEADTEKCSMGRGCPHKTYCPHYQKQFENDPLFATEKNVSMLDLFGDDETPAAPAPAAPQNPAPATAPPPVEQKVVPTPAEVKAQLTAPAAPLLSPKPADAPPSKPELAAEPLPLAQAALPAAEGDGTAKRRGRPKKMQITEGSPAPATSPAASSPAQPGSSEKAMSPTTIDNVPVEVVSKGVERSFAVTRVAVRQALTINLGNYESSRVEVEMEAVGDDPDLRVKLGALVKAALRDEAKDAIAKRKVG